MRAEAQQQLGGAAGLSADRGVHPRAGERQRHIALQQVRGLCGRMQRTDPTEQI
jgi:hypothetical protein